jgi:Cu(I)/Ag(I) efflux system membrane fusion protein
VLRALAETVVEATAALANDDFASYQKRFPSLVAAAQLLPALPRLELGPDLKTARRSFEPWSTAVADLLRPQRATLGLKIFQCSMSPVLGKGRWIQRAAPLKNPFFGDEMSDCGEEVP